jgi:protein-tyrosine-phosphatase
MKILFVCTGNSFRSPVAEALMKNIKQDFEAGSA